MNQNRKNIILISLFFICFTPYNNLFPQTKHEINYGVQCDLSSVIFVNTFSGSFDVEFIKMQDISYAGIRIGIDHIISRNVSLDMGGGSGGGHRPGSPYRYINLLGKFSVSGRLFEINLCPGIAYHTNSDSYTNNKDGVYLKFLSEAKWKIYKNYFGLIFKFAATKELYGGLGLFVGFNSRDFKK